ncbi:MAG: cbb3-type cytochrome oxidase assembly protein CcoS [Kordiimonas sp.]|nr:cbb3-type cytochrome oxidase assembly protein CcoS [Kordiimonas sp.]|tara:strand:+ start:879 stop:1094 length:216 start_codon:yes stop_codon:yes gene_type:complete
MSNLVFLIPVALLLGGLGLIAFLWTLKTGQYDDLDGASYRALFEEDDIAAEQQKSSKESPSTPDTGTPYQS